MIEPSGELNPLDERNDVVKQARSPRAASRERQRSFQIMSERANEGLETFNARGGVPRTLVPNNNKQS
jgi:hypothetical protein